VLDQALALLEEVPVVGQSGGCLLPDCSPGEFTSRQFHISTPRLFYGDTGFTGTIEGHKDCNGRTGCAEH